MRLNAFSWVILLAIATVASGATTPVLSARVEFHWDVVVAAAITGLFGTIQIYMLSKLHTMVNSQQTKLNELSQLAEREAAFAKGVIQGGSAERARAETAAGKIVETAAAIVLEQGKKL